MTRLIKQHVDNKDNAALNDERGEIDTPYDENVDESILISLCTENSFREIDR